MTPVSNDPPDRAAINRTNAQHSTGPRTEAGKQRTKLNALRHGLTGQTIVLPTEDHAAYQRHSQSFLDESQPKLANETQIVQSLIDTSWQLDRTLPAVGFVFSNRTFGLTARAHDASSSSASLSAPRPSCSTGVGFVFSNRTFTLAAQAHDASSTSASLSAPAEDGFVFSNEEIETYSRREDRAGQANRQDLYGYA